MKGIAQKKDGTVLTLVRPAGGGLTELSVLRLYPGPSMAVACLLVYHIKYQYFIETMVATHPILPKRACSYLLHAHCELDDSLIASSADGNRIYKIFADGM